MWLTIGVPGIFLILLTYHQTLGQDNICLNRGGDEIRCIPLKSCKPLIEHLNKTNSRDNFELLGRFLCARVIITNKIFEVCCPYKVNNHNNDNYNNNNNNHYYNKNHRNNRPVTPSDTSLNDRWSSTGNYGPLYPPVCGYTNAKFTKVVDGVPASLGAWPWATLLGYRSKRNRSKPLFKCGGALISARHVLTAAHCVHGYNDLYLVRLGELDILDDNDGAAAIDLLIERKDIHPQYDPYTISNDIAVLKFERDIQFTELIKPLCLPLTEDIQNKGLENAFPYIVGWGSLGYGLPSASALQQLQLPVVEQNQCRAAYRSQRVIIDDRVLCAGYEEGGKDACNGDSGGPMMYPIGKSWYSIGVVSVGTILCGTPNFPGVYTRTQYFLDFILQHLN